MKSASPDSIKAVVDLLVTETWSANQWEFPGRTQRHAEDRFEALELTLSAVSNALNQRIAEYKRDRNGFCALLALPHELLVKILTFALASRPIEKVVQQRSILTLTCSTFHDAIETTPQMWSWISSEHSEAAISAALTKFSSNPLTVECIFNYSRVRYGDTAEAERDRVSRLIVQLCSQIRRWESATIHLISDRDVCQALKSEAPKLKHLDLSLLHGTATCNLLGGSTGVLKWLRLVAIQAPWTSPVFTGLKHLALQDVNSPSPSAAQILEILSQCPDLEVLVLVRIVRFETSDLTTRIVPLLCLTSLVLEDLSPTLLRHLLGGIHIPSCYKFTLRCDIDINSIPLVLSSSLRIALKPWILYTNPKPLNFILGPDYVLWIEDTEVWAGEGEIMNLIMQEPNKGLDWIAEFCQTDPNLISRPVELTLRDLSLADPVIRTSLSIFVGITSLTLGRGRGTTDAEVILEWLAEPSLDGSIAKWPLPHLAALTVNFLDLPPGILGKLVECRLGVTRHPSLPESIIDLRRHLPRPLMTVSVHGPVLSVGLIQELEHIRRIIDRYSINRICEVVLPYPQDEEYRT